MKSWIQTAAALFFLTFSASMPLQAEVAPGASAPDFTLTDTNGNSHSLSGFQGKFVVLEWLNHDCPFIKKHYDSGNMQKLQKDYTGKGVVWLSVNSSAAGKQGNYPAEKWNEMTAAKNAAPTAVLLDGDGKVGQSYGAKTTPHMFVINPEGVLIYAGALDSIPSPDPADIPQSENYVQKALDQAMAGEEVSNPSTPSYGCSVKY